MKLCLTLLTSYDVIDYLLNSGLNYQPRTVKSTRRHIEPYILLHTLSANLRLSQHFQSQNAKFPREISSVDFFREQHKRLIMHALHPTTV